MNKQVVEVQNVRERAIGLRLTADGKNYLCNSYNLLFKFK